MVTSSAAVAPADRVGQDLFSAFARETDLATCADDVGDSIRRTPIDVAPLPTGGCLRDTWDHFHDQVTYSS